MSIAGTKTQVCNKNKSKVKTVKQGNKEQGLSINMLTNKELIQNSWTQSGNKQITGYELDRGPLSPWEPRHKCGICDMNNIGRYEHLS